MPIGSEHPIARQTMTTTDTKDVDATVEQVMRCADAGADLVRLTVQGNREADAGAAIREKLFKYGYDTPLVADIHFNPKTALRIADAFEKIRVNPGNFADGVKKFDDLEYDSDEAYQLELEKIAELFTPLVEKCKSLDRAIRIGTNHGSLSNRILSYYGDTPNGMVKSAFEFADVCRGLDYHNFLFSMKASNPLVMVQAYRLLAHEMYKKDWDYPLHLGVTEAGEGEDGRMKSAIGIGALLGDGLGDTIRVSLTEDPELELAPCSTLAALGMDAYDAGLGVPDFAETHRDFQDFQRRKGALPAGHGASGRFDFGNAMHRDGSVFSVVGKADLARAEATYSKLGCMLAVGMPIKDIATADSILLAPGAVPAVDDDAGRLAVRRLMDAGVGVFAGRADLAAAPVQDAVAVVTSAEALAGAAEAAALPEGCERFAVVLDGSESREQVAALCGLDPARERLMCFFFKIDALSRVHATRRLMQYVADAPCGADVPVMHHLEYAADVEDDELVLRAGAEGGGALVDGLGDGVVLECAGKDLDYLRRTAFGMLQGSRMRSTKTEYISCPSCGRTLFDLQEVTNQIQLKTGHLPGVSIAIMGCIVNGPGEMADADFGYVGTVPGKIDLYVGREVVKRGVDMEGAPDALIELIKEYDRWQDPPADDADGDSPAVEELVAA